MKNFIKMLPFAKYRLKETIKGLHVSERFQNLNSLQEFLNAGGPVNVEMDKHLPLQWCDGSVEMTQLLLDSGANPNLTNSRGITPFVHLIDIMTDIELNFIQSLNEEKINSQILVLNLYLQHGADPNARDPDGCSVLEKARRYPKIMLQLLNAGSVPDIKSMTRLSFDTTQQDILLRAATNTSIDVLKTMISTPNQKNLEIITSVLESRMLSELGIGAVGAPTFKL